VVRAAQLLATSVFTVVALGLSSWLAIQLGAGQAETASAAAAAQANNVTVQVGGGQDTEQMLAYFPMNVRIRAGDSVTFRINTDREPHTVTFTQGVPPGPGWVQAPVLPPGGLMPAFPVPVPGGGPNEMMLNPAIAFPTRFPGAPQEIYNGGGYLNSGVMTASPLAPGAPLFDTLTVTFDTPGTFPYLCAVHGDRMWGTVEVTPPDADVPTQADIAAQATLEMPAFTNLFTMARAEAQQFTRPNEPGPGGTSTAFVRAGMTELFSTDGRAHISEFFPRDLTVRTGDTVVWGSTFFHSVTFSPPPAPSIADLFIERPQPQGPPLLLLNPRVWTPSKPAPTYDPVQYYNSADMGPFSIAGTSFSLAFDRPGTFEYICIFHVDQGMKGTVTVVPRG
jgi:plastocyanin